MSLVSIKPEVWYMYQTHSFLANFQLGAWVFPDSGFFPFTSADKQNPYLQEKYSRIVFI